MIIKLFWEGCSEFIVEEEDAFLLEADAVEALSTIVPALSQREQLKFEQMKDVYSAAGKYYFLVTRDAQEIKFESSAILSADMSGRGGKIKALPDLPVSRIEDVRSIDPSAY
jgi:hypothetical protein